MNLITLKVKSVEKVSSGKKDYSVITLEDPTSKRVLKISAPSSAPKHVTDALEGIVQERADIYSLISSMMKVMDVTIAHATIERSPTNRKMYNANICLTRPDDDDKTFYAILQGRPSDAIPMAILHSAEIRAEESLLNEP